MKLYAFRVFRRAATKKKNQSNQGTTPQNIVQNQETEFIEEVSGLTEKGENQETAQTASITQSFATDQTSSRGRFKVVSNKGRDQARGRGGRSFARTNR